jgi:GR25 family glycosyltransferase involved in LPS biosynthesis
MDCFYINLDRATERRSRLESNFAAIKKPNWSLTRFPAIDTEYVRANNIAGCTTPGEKGCFLSHKILIGENLAKAGPLFIAEDDAAFGARSCALIDAILKQSPNADWDILFTDVGTPQLSTMIDLVKYRRGLAAKGEELAFLDLSKLNFVGSTAYLVNPKSKQKLYGLLDSVTEIDLPYDLYLRQQAHAGILKVRSLFPFVTTLSDYSEDSQIKVADLKRPDLRWNLFRKMVWAERNLASCKPALEQMNGSVTEQVAALFKQLRSSPDEELNAFGVLFTAIAADMD